ncbi:glycosyltransferase [Flavobacterium sp.]|uniref:glycosyltransferase family 4 protein n=1 Tax=Flavobacterium sp. TaxID=239 RepID=UPI00286A676C|nr:glycosyltransferase [Flavobacterium sp.]
MKLLVVSNAPIINKDNSWFAYSPYVKEMEIWSKYANEFAFCCPEWRQENGLLISKIPFNISKIFLLSDFNVTSLVSIFKSFFQIIYNVIIIFRAMIWADHIHLRCPGNIGLLALIAQIFFPSKIKTAKYAGNWDPKAKNPWSYKLQKWILSNTFLTRNMKVLIYGQWENQSKNLKSFFTASYFEFDKTDIKPRNFSNGIKIIFVGTLSSGKRPLYAIQLIEKLLENGFKVELLFFGEGNQRNVLEDYITDNKLSEKVFIKGNQDMETIKKAYQESHFVVLPSESEGWPKVIAEGMFWGCVPIATHISCVSNMLDNGNRGLILNLNLQNDLQNIQILIQDNHRYNVMSEKAINWSRKYTLDYFEQEIKLLLQA